MTNKNKKLNLILIIFLLCSTAMTAQEMPAKEFSWQAFIEDVPRNGFYNILLHPDLLSESQAPGYTDYRIYQDNKTEVPYLLRKESFQYDISSIKSFDVIENRQVTNGTSSFIFSNTTGQAIDRFTLMVKNSWVQKNMNVTGSNDLKQWYGLRPDFVFNPADPEVDLPPTDYKYIRLLINDSNNAPLNITAAGQLINEQKFNTPIPVSYSSRTISNIAHSTETGIQIVFPGKYVIDKLSFTITAHSFYKRQAWVNGESFTLTSGQPNEVVLSHEIKTDTLMIRIENEDNPPLGIDDVQIWQLPRYLTAYLEQGHSYLILTGNPALTAPKYDLAYFADSLKKELPLISIENEQMKPISKPASAVVSTLFTSQVWIWVAIVGIIALLGFMAFRMLKDMQEKK